MSGDTERQAVRFGVPHAQPIERRQDMQISGRKMGLRHVQLGRFVKPTQVAMPFFDLAFECSCDRNIESTSLVQVEVALARTFICSLQANSSL